MPNMVPIWPILPNLQAVKQSGSVFWATLYSVRTHDRDNQFLLCSHSCYLQWWAQTFYFKFNFN